MTGEEKQKARKERLTPGEAIRAYCLHCVGGSAPDVRACDADDPKYHVCPFHPYRLGRGRPSVKTIRKFCLQCMGNYADFVLDCETTDCFCYPYRMGKNPLMARQGRTADEMRKIRALKGRFVKEISGNFERSPLAPTPTLPRGETKNLSAKSAVSCIRKKDFKKTSQSRLKKPPTLTLEREFPLDRENERSKSIPYPYPYKKSEKQTTGRGA